MEVETVWQNIKKSSPFAFPILGQGQTKKSSTRPEKCKNDKILAKRIGEQRWMWAMKADKKKKLEYEENKRRNIYFITLFTATLFTIQVQYRMVNKRIVA